MLSCGKSGNYMYNKHNTLGKHQEVNKMNAEKIKEEPARMEQSRSEAWDEWTEACLAWWDVYLEEFGEDNM